MPFFLTFLFAVHQNERAKGKNPVLLVISLHGHLCRLKSGLRPDKGDSINSNRELARPSDSANIFLCDRQLTVSLRYRIQIELVELLGKREFFFIAERRKVGKCGRVANLVESRDGFKVGKNPEVTFIQLPLADKLSVSTCNNSTIMSVPLTMAYSQYIDLDL